jgi:hypothetical protein
MAIATAYRCARELDRARGSAPTGLEVDVGATHMDMLQAERDRDQVQNDA